MNEYKVLNKFGVQALFMQMTKPKPSFSTSSSSSPSSLLRTKPRFSPYLFTLLAFIVFASVLYGHDSIFIFQHHSNPHHDTPTHTLFSAPTELTQPPRQGTSSSLFFLFNFLLPFLFGGL